MVCKTYFHDIINHVQNEEYKIYAVEVVLCDILWQYIHPWYRRIHYFSADEHIRDNLHFLEMKKQRKINNDKSLYPSPYIENTKLFHLFVLFENTNCVEIANGSGKNTRRFSFVL